MATRRLYYDDSYQREFDAQLLSCEPELHGTTPAWGAVLDCTALYPTSGGQPNDLGKLGNANVLDVRDDEDDIVHVVDRQLPLGSCRAAWIGRGDSITCSSTPGSTCSPRCFRSVFGRATVSFHLGSDLCTIDLRGRSRRKNPGGAERAANQIISRIVR